ncbi:MAG: ATP-binding protein, partial [Gammaproteobacteria bacterium]
RDLERILPDRQLAGESLANLLRPLLSDKDYAMTLDYLRLLFQPRLKEKMLLNVNPLEEVEVNITDGSAGGAQNRVLSFAFNRVYDGKSILHVLVSVTDVTDKVMLARELEASRERAREQMELLFGIVHVEPARVSAFLAETRTRVGNVNELLKTAEIGGSGNLHGLVDGIFRQIHAVKGDAAMLGLALFENAAHRFEDELNRLREQSDIKGQDFVPLALGLDEMRRYLVETGELVDKIAGFGELSTEKAPDLIDSLQGLITDIADKVDRRVELSAHDFDPRLIPATATQQIKDILIQLIRNAVSHGIEHPDERRGRNKPETGQVRLSARKADGKVEISVRDDGAGIQIGRIRRKALERGLRSPDELEAMNNRQVVSLIFEPGFSTADEVNEVAGRGVGMDIVRDEIARMGGRIRLAYAPDSFTEFTLIVPEDAGATTPA